MILIQFFCCNVSLDFKMRHCSGRNCSFCLTLFDMLELETPWCEITLAAIGIVILALLVLAVSLGCSRRKLKAKYLTLKAEVANNDHAFTDSAMENIEKGASCGDVEATSVHTMNQVDTENSSLIKNECEGKSNKQETVSNSESDVLKSRKKENGICKEEVQLTIIEPVSQTVKPDADKNFITVTAPKNENAYAEVTKKSSEASNFTDKERNVSDAENKENSPRTIKAVSPSFTLQTNNQSSSTPYVLAMKTNSECPYQLATDAPPADLTEPCDSVLTNNDRYDRLFTSKPREDGMAYDNVILPNRNTVKLTTQASVTEPENSEDLPPPPPPLPPPYMPSDEEDEEPATNQESIYDIPE